MLTMVTEFASIDVANPTQPRVVGFYEIGMSATTGVSRIGDYLYTVGSTAEDGYDPKLHIFRFVP